MAIHQRRRGEDEVLRVGGELMKFRNAVIVLRRRREVEIQRQSALRIAGNPIIAPAIGGRRHRRSVPPHVAPEGLTRRELRPANQALVDLAAAIRRFLSTGLLGNRLGLALFFLLSRRRRIGANPRPLVAGPVAAEGLERRERPVAGLALVDVESRPIGATLHRSDKSPVGEPLREAFSGGCCGTLGEENQAIRGVLFLVRECRNGGAVVAGGEGGRGGPGGWWGRWAVALGALASGGGDLSVFFETR